MKLGTNLPEHLILEDPGALQEFWQAVKDMGYDDLTVYFEGSFIGIPSDRVLLGAGDFVGR